MGRRIQERVKGAAHARARRRKQERVGGGTRKMGVAQVDWMRRMRERMLGDECRSVRGGQRIARKSACGATHA